MRQQNESPEHRIVSQIRTRALLFLVVAVVAGAGAVMLVKQYLDRVETVAASAAPKTTGVVVAAMDIPIAVQLEAKHVAVVSWPVDHVPAGSFGDPKKVIGKTIRQNIVKGEAVLAERLADEDLGQGLAALLADGMRAMAVEVDAVVGVAGFVQPGDYVDVITTMQADDETRKERNDEAAKVSKIILQNVRVLAVGEHLTTSVGGKPVNVKVVTLGVTPPESEKLALASQYGQIQLALRSRVDQITTETEGVTPAKLLVGTAAAPAEVASSSTDTEAKPRQTYRHQRPKPEVVVEAAKKPEAPVVEILRGTKVEQRKLRVPETE